MPVYNNIGSRRFYVCNFFYIEASVGIFFFVKIMSKIIIVAALHDGIVNICSVYGKPADEIIVFLIQAGEVMQNFWIF